MLVVKLHGNHIVGYFPSAEKFNPKADLNLIPEEVRSLFAGVIDNHDRYMNIEEEASGKIVSSERGIDDPYLLTKIINLIALNERKSTKDSLKKYTITPK